ncbi:hypothetical protein M3Y95_01255300 [Aphelenchoides besseyi]|nr:hypothetical protein M3Y95_01255300 [Aphelenchoides besseyi]
MRSCTLWFAIFWLANGNEVYNVEFLYPLLRINIGTPIQPISLHIDLTTDVLFVLSANCGEVNTLRCPRLCYSNDYAEMYCSLECQRLDDVEWCKKPIYTLLRFDSTNSSSYNSTNEFRKENLRNHFAQIGQLAHETIAFTPLNDGTASLELKDWLFVNGMILDSDLIINSAGGVLGLLPGKSNLIQLLYKQRRILKPVVSILLLLPRITIGDYNQEYCSNWWNRDAVEANWILSFDSAAFLNQTWNSNVYVTVTFDLQHDTTFIPDETFDELLDSEVIIQVLNSYYPTSCAVNFDLKFTVDNRELLVPSSNFVVKPFFDIDQCLVKLSPLRDWYSSPRLYANEPNWVLGFPFMQLFCIAFNYETNQIGIANLNDPNDN